MNELASMLKARRPDLVDGFPCKAVLKVLATSGDRYFKLAYLNQILEPNSIEVAFTNKHELHGGFHHVGLAAATTFIDGSIEVKVTPRFFKPNEIQPLIHALRFQSLVAHELVHRKQFKSKELYAETFRSDEDITTVEYLNDHLELAAMGAEVAHDLRALSFLLDSEPREISPRLKDLMSNAGLMSKESIKHFDRSVKRFY